MFRPSEPDRHRVVIPPASVHRGTHSCSPSAQQPGRSSDSIQIGGGMLEEEDGLPRPKTICVCDCLSRITAGRSLPAQELFL